MGRQAEVCGQDVWAGRSRSHRDPAHGSREGSRVTVAVAIAVTV